MSKVLFLLLIFLWLGFDFWFFLVGDIQHLGFLGLFRSFNNLWNLDDRLLECRGTVVDKDWNVVVLPFKKVFNLGENDTQIDPEKEVILPEKIYPLRLDKPIHFE